VRVQNVTNNGLTIKADIPVEDLAPNLGTASTAVARVDEALIRK
jgi:hypothetical protein